MTEARPDNETIVVEPALLDEFGIDPAELISHSGLIELISRIARTEQSKQDGTYGEVA